MDTLVRKREQRRALLLALASGPLLVRAAPAQRKRLVLVGFAAHFTQSSGFDDIVRILGARGFVDGREIEVVRVTIDGASDESPKKGLDHVVARIERDVLPLRPDVILALGSIMAKASQLATQTIPIVASVSDPVDIGIAASIARPGGNVTGLSGGVDATSAKLMELLKGLIRGLSRVAIFHEPRPMSTRYAGHYERAARRLGVEPVMVSSMENSVLLEALRSLPAKHVQAGVWAWGASLKRSRARRSRCAYRSWEPRKRRPMPVASCRFRPRRRRRLRNSRRSWSRSCAAPIPPAFRSATRSPSGSCSTGARRRRSASPSRRSCSCAPIG